jgi:hypothetical protein
VSFNPILARTLFQKGDAVSHTGNTSRTSLMTYVMKAGTMGVNDHLEIWQFNQWTNNANTKTFEIVMGGTNIFTRNVTTTASSIGVRTVTNRNALNSQVIFTVGADIGLGIASTTNVTISVDTAVDVTFEWFVTLTNSADTASVQATAINLYKDQG